MLTQKDLLLIQEIFEKQFEVQFNKHFECAFNRHFENAFDKHATKLKDELHEEIKKDIDEAVAPLAIKDELYKLEERQKKQFRKLNKKVDFVTKYFDREIVDLHKKVDKLTAY